MQEYRLFAEDAVRGAGKVLLELFETDVEINTKLTENDLVTTADIKANDYLMSRIREAYPDHGIISEEVPEDQWDNDQEYIWTIDPLDGTKNFSTGLPNFGSMLALLHKGVPVLGVVYLPVTDELLVGEKGNGAYLNGKRVHCSDRTILKESFGCFTTSFSYHNRTPETKERTHRFFHAMTETPFVGMTFWSIAPQQVLVASGRYDWAALTGDIWDFMPAIVILQEAGCKVTDWDGVDLPRRTNGLVAANDELHKQLIDIITPSS